MNPVAREIGVVSVAGVECHSVAVQPDQEIPRGVQTQRCRLVGGLARESERLHRRQMLDGVGGGADEVDPASIGPHPELIPFDHAEGMDRIVGQQVRILLTADLLFGKNVGPVEVFRIRVDSPQPRFTADPDPAPVVLGNRPYLCVTVGVETYAADLPRVIEVEAGVASDPDRSVPVAVDGIDGGYGVEFDFCNVPRSRS